MKKVLIVSYTPRENSNTKKLLDFTVEKLKSQSEKLNQTVEFTTVDLAREEVPMLQEKELNLYVKRNFGGQVLTAEEEKILKPIDEYCNGILSADLVIVAYPVYNFTFPGPVKCWFDEVLQAGRTFKYTESGFEGMLKGKKAIVITTSGGEYSTNTAWDFSTPLAHSQFNFMGMDNTVITAGGMSFSPEKIQESLSQAMAKIEKEIENHFVTAEL